MVIRWLPSLLVQSISPDQALSRVMQFNNRMKSHGLTLAPRQTEIVVLLRAGSRYESETKWSSQSQRRSTSKWRLTPRFNFLSILSERWIRQGAKGVMSLSQLMAIIGSPDLIKQKSWWKLFSQSYMEWANSLNRMIYRKKLSTKTKCSSGGIELLLVSEPTVLVVDEIIPLNLLARSVRRSNIPEEDGGRWWSLRPRGKTPGARSLVWRLITWSMERSTDAMPYLCLLYTSRCV